jgi:hypothetical protein
LASLQGVVKTFNKDLEAIVDAVEVILLMIYVVDIDVDVACFLVEEDSINERCFGIQ